MPYVHDDSEDQKEILAELSDFATEAIKLQEMFADHRARLRERALIAVEHYGISVLRAATTAGIDRRTLSVWLEVARAEEKGRRK